MSHVDKRYGPQARLVGAHERAKRLLYSPDGDPLSWPSSAGGYRHALAELFDAVGETGLISADVDELVDS